MLNDIYVRVTSDTSTVRVIKHNDNSIKYIKLYDIDDVSYERISHV